MRLNFIRKLLLLLAATSPLALAQPIEFDVVSILPNHTGDPGYNIRTPPGGRFTARNITVKTLILYALDIKDFQLANLPGWCDSERYDIEAKSGAQTTIDPEQLRPLIRKVLESRFHLTVHRETKDLPLYSLIAAKGGRSFIRTPASPRTPPIGEVITSTPWPSRSLNLAACWKPSWIA